MIFDFPTIRHRTVELEKSPGYVHRTTVITRRPWLRIIWDEHQKTILLGRHRINFTSEPDATEHMRQVLDQHGDWYEE